MIKTNPAQFAKDYRLPLQATLLFVLIVALMMVMRYFQLTALAGVLPNSSSKGKDYATLLSTDKADEFKKTASPDEAPPGTSTASQPSPTSKSTSGGSSTNTTVTTTTTTNSTPSASTPPTTPTGGTTTPTGGTTPPANPFSAKVNNINLDSSTVQCSGTTTATTVCYKTYVFSDTIETVNGPGNVDYGWESNISSANETGSFLAAAGNASRVMQKTISLPCDQPGQINLDLIITAPNQDQSNTFTTNHSC